jgi:hypothetical protein
MSMDNPENLGAVADGTETKEPTKVRRKIETKE